MRAGNVPVPVILFGGEKWGALTDWAKSHEIVGTKVKKKKDMSLPNGHQVRRLIFTGQVHWKIPVGVEADVSGIAPGRPPRRFLRRA